MRWAMRMVFASEPGLLSRLRTCRWPNHEVLFLPTMVEKTRSSHIFSRPWLKKQQVFPYFLPTMIEKTLFVQYFLPMLTVSHCAKLNCGMRLCRCTAFRECFYI
mmetsp:Transcript_52706/g.104710  ORF Transcript_52706/g.104710 Transcript_52706/m.104710 type:complete len:104 (-) Transcript_52706:18-329(-)